MGLRERVARAVAERLRPWLVADANISILFSGTQVHFQLSNVNLDVSTVNKLAMATSPLLLQEASVGEVEIMLALFGSPVLTLVVRGMHFVLKPRSAEDSWWVTSKRSTKEQETVAALGKSNPQGDSAPKVAEKQSKGAAAVQFLTNVLASLAISSVRVELHDCSVKFVSHSLKPWSYSCSASLDSIILEEGSMDDEGLSAGGFFGASVRAVLGSWDQKGGTVRKRCMFQRLGMHLEIENGHNKPHANDPRRNSSSDNRETMDSQSSKNYGGQSGGGNRRRRQELQSVQNAEDDNIHSSNLVIAHERDHILLFEIVAVAARIRETEFLGLEVDVPEVLVGVDAKEVEILMVLVAQVNGTGAHETDKTLAMVSAKVCSTQPLNEQAEPSAINFNKEVQPEVGTVEGNPRSGTEISANATRTLPTVSKISAAVARQPKVVSIPAHGLFGILAWRLWVRSFSQVVSVVGQTLIAGLMSLKAAPALFKEAWKRIRHFAHLSQDMAVQLPSMVTGEGSVGGVEEAASNESQESNSENTLFKVVKNRGPTFAIYFNRGLLTLSCAASSGQSMDTVDSSILGNKASSLQPGVHLTLERLSLEYGQDHIGSGGRVVLGSLQIHLIAVNHSQLNDGSSLPLQQGRWPTKSSSNLQLIGSRPYTERSKKDFSLKEFQDIAQVPQAAMALEKHWKWQDSAARAWSRHVWKSIDDSHLERISGSGGKSFPNRMAAPRGGVSRPFLIAELAIAQETKYRAEVPGGGLMTCAVSMGSLECYADSTICTRIRPMLEQLATPTNENRNVGPVPRNLEESEMSMDEMYLKYMNLCGHYLGVAVPEMHLELSTAIESPKFTFATVVSQSEEVGEHLESSRGSSLVIELGSLQFLTWPARRIEVLSDVETTAQGAATLGWWDECVDRKLWVKRPPSPKFPLDSSGSEEQQIGHNLYIAVEDMGVMLRIDHNSQVDVPLVGPISCLVESSFCRDELRTPRGQIKSTSVAFEGKVAPVTIHLYLEEVAIVAEIVSCGMALMDEFVPLRKTMAADKVEQRGEGNILRNEVLGVADGRLDASVTESNSTDTISDEFSTMVFVLLFNVQLEAFQIALADHRHGEKSEFMGKQTASPGRKSSGSGKDSGNESDAFMRSGNKERHQAGSGRSCYIATLPILLDLSVGSGCESFLFVEINGAQLGIIAKKVKTKWQERNEQQEVIVQNLLQGSKLEFDKLMQLANTGFALDRCAVQVRLPMLIGDGTSPPNNQEAPAEGEGEAQPVRETLSSSNELATIKGEESSSEAPRLSNSPIEADPGMQQKSGMQGDQGGISRKWLFVSVDVGRILLTDGLGEALVEKIMVLASGGSTLHIDFGLDKDVRNTTVDIEGGLIVLQTTSLHSLVDYFNVNMKMLSDATTISQPTKKEPKTVIALQRSSYGGGPSPLLKTTDRSVSLPPWALTKSPKKVRRLLSAPRRLQAESNLTPANPPKKGYEGLLTANLTAFSLVLVQQSSTSAEGFLMEVDAKGKVDFKAGNMSRTSIALTRASILGLQRRAFSELGSTSVRNSSRTPQFRHKNSGGSESDADLHMRKSQHSHLSLTPTSSGMSDDDHRTMDNNDGEVNWEPSMEDGSWKPVDESHSFILERLSIKCVIEKVRSGDHPDIWKWRNAWKGSCSFAGLDFAITTSEVELLLSVVAPLSGLSSSTSEPPIREYTRSQVQEVETEESSSENDLPDGAVIAIKDMIEHQYLAVEENTANSGTYRLVGVLHYSLVGDKALFKVKHQKNKNTKTVWFSLLSLHAKDSNGESYAVHYRPGSGLADVTTGQDTSWELWQCVPSLEPRSEASEELGVHTSRQAYHLVNQKSKCGLALMEGAAMLVKQPGNPFKLRILAQRDMPPENVNLVSLEDTTTQEVVQDPDQDAHLYRQAVSATVIPEVKCEIENFTFTLLHEASGGLHLLPLLRLCMHDMGAVLQMGSGKTRVMFGCNISLDYFQAQSSCWVAMINPIGTELLYRARGSQEVAGVVSKKTPVAIFSRLRKVDIVISELSLDTLLFLIGALELAGPYTLRHSPVLANRCEVENQTGVDLLCRFDHGDAKQEGIVRSWETDAFLIRHTTSRRDLTSAEVASSVDLYLQKQGGGVSSAVQVLLGETGVKAVRTRLQFGEGRRTSAPGPIVVVDTARQSQGGISLTVSPMVRIRNASGLSLELQCRRPKQEGEGAVVLLEDGDIIDDSMGSFDALHLEGELRKALTSFNVGNYILSIRPSPSESSLSENEAGKEDTRRESAHEWSEDVKGAKAVRVSNLFEKFHYSFKKRAGGRSGDFNFGTVFCPAKIPSKEDDGLHFLIRTRNRQVPVTRSDKEQVHGKMPVAAWQEQQELLLLPTIRILNLFKSNITAKLFALTPGQGMKGKTATISQPKNEEHIGLGKKALMYADLGNLSLVITHHDFGLSSKPVIISGRDKNSPDLSPESGELTEMELEVDFGDNVHYGMLKVHQDDDGVLEVITYTKYALHNNSHVPLLYCAPKQRNSYLWRRGQSKDSNLEWPSEETVSTLHPGSTISWFNRSSKVMMKQALPEAQPAILDLDSLAGSTEISLRMASTEKGDQRVQLGVEVQLPAVGDTNPTRSVHLKPRYVVVNKSSDAICVCQDGFQDDMGAVMVLNPGEKTALHCRVSPDQSDEKGKKDKEQDSSFQLPLTVRFKPQDPGWDWSGPVCAAALGSFWIKIRPQGQGPHNKQTESKFHKQAKGKSLFAVAEVQEDSPSLTMSFRRHSLDAIPYRLENALRSGAVLYNQKGLTQTEVLEAGAAGNYVWDDLGLPHKLVVTIQGTQLCHAINMDKIRSWKHFGAVRRNKGFSLRLPFQDEQEEDSDKENGAPSTSDKLLNIGYEVNADGPTRVLRICEDIDSNRQIGWQSNMKRPQSDIELKVPLLCLSIVEPSKQRNDTSSDDNEVGDTAMERRVLYAPIILARITSLLIESLVTAECTLCQLKVERFDVDVKWQGAPLAHMLRVHGQDFPKLGQTVLHAAAVVAHRGSNPIQLHYLSLLLQAVDLNIDEDTLMKLAPFYRSSLAPSTGPSRLIYYERFEIHPIKILASFTPGNPRADYTSAQETLRALLHSVIKIPEVRGTKVELNGVLLSNALLTYRQLAVKCAQHYSWYAMRAIYIARGSSLLPPAFASLFDDSAQSSLDVFFDPSNGSVDMQGLTLGMFNLLSKGLRKKGQGGSNRLLGDVEQSFKAAGSNIAFAVVTEVSDSVLKGAETNGFDGLVSGFRRGILNVAMRPAVLRSAVVQGGSTRRIKLDRSVGIDEVYVEGYLQAMLDALFKQDYLKVKVSDDQVLLKNLPPNTALMEEIMAAVKKFLVGEGLLAGESSLAAARSTRRLGGENERRLGPAMIALCEQLLVVIVVRGLRRHATKVLHLPKTETEKAKDELEAEIAAAPPEKKEPQERALPRVRRAVTNFVISSGVAYLDGRLCRHIPNTLVRRIVSGFLLSFVE